MTNKPVQHNTKRLYCIFRKSNQQLKPLMFMMFIVHWWSRIDKILNPLNYGQNTNFKILMDKLLQHLQLISIG